MPLFRSSGKSPKEVVSELRETLLYLAHPSPAAQTTEGKRPSKKHRSRGAGRKHEHSDADLTKAAGEECAALLTSLKSILFPDVAVPGDKSQLDEVVKQCYDAEVLLHLVRASVLEELPTPEARRDIVRIFRYFLERQTDNTVKYIIKNQALISNLISGYESGKPQVVANCGLMLRACSRYKSLVWVILLLKSDDVMQFFGFMQSKQFEVLSDAFVTFKELLRHDDLTAKFLEENQEEVFQRLSEVLFSDFYISKHVCLEWLQELLNESNSIREYFYSSAANLKTVMTLLGSDPSVTIRFKALDIMQGFLTITEKEREVREILLVNRERLNGLVVELLTKFDKDEKHCPEPGRKFLLKTLEDPELSPALSELEVIPVEYNMAEEFHDHQLQSEPPQDPASEQPPVKMIDSQNDEPEPPSQDEQPPDQSQDSVEQLPLVHDQTNNDEEEHPPGDEQTQEQEEHQQDEFEHSPDDAAEKQPQAEKQNEDGESEMKEQPQSENLKSSKAASELEEKLNEYRQDDSADQTNSKEQRSAAQPNKEQVQIIEDKDANQTKAEEPLNSHSEVEKEDELLLTEQSLEQQSDPSHQHEIKEISVGQPNDSTKIEEPLPLHSELTSTSHEESQKEASLEHQHESEEPSPDQLGDQQQNKELSPLLSDSRESLPDQPSEKETVLQLPDTDRTQDPVEPLPAADIEETAVLEGSAELPPPGAYQHEELSPMANGVEPESLPDQPPENETAQMPDPDRTEDPAETLCDIEEATILDHTATDGAAQPLPDIEEPLPNGVEPESLPSQPPENKTAPDRTQDPAETLLDIEGTTMLDHTATEGSAQPLPDVEELLLPNGIEPESLPNQPPENETAPDRTEDPADSEALPVIEETTILDHTATEGSAQPLPDIEEPLPNGVEPESLPDQPPENETDHTEGSAEQEPLPGIEETTLLDHKQDPVEPLLDVELLPTQINGDEPESLSYQPSENETNRTVEPLPNAKDPLPNQVNGDKQESMLNQPSENETDHTEDPVEPLPDVEEPLPHQINGDQPQAIVESLLNQPSENEANHIVDSAEPLPDFVEPLTNQINGDQPESLPYQSEITLPDDKEGLAELLPNVDEPFIPNQINGDKSESVPDHPSENETTVLIDHTESPAAEPLLTDVEGTLPAQLSHNEKPENRNSLTEPDESTLIDDTIQNMEQLPIMKESSQNEDTEKTLPDKSEDKTTSLDHSENAEPLPDRKEELSTILEHLFESSKSSFAAEEKKAPDEQKDHTDQIDDQQPSFDQHDNRYDKAENEGALPDEQLFNFADFSKMPTLELSHVQPLAAEEVEEHLPKVLEQLEHVLTNHPDAAQFDQQYESTKPDDPSETQEQELNDSAMPEHPSETPEQFVQGSEEQPDSHPSGKTQQQIDDSTKPDTPPWPDGTQGQQLGDYFTKPDLPATGEIQEQPFDQDTTAPNYPDQPSSSADRKMESPEELLPTEPSISEEEEDMPKQQLPLSVEEPQHEHQSQPLPDVKQDCIDKSSDQGQLPQQNYPAHVQLEPEEQDSTKGPSELVEGTKEVSEQEQLSESELPIAMETREILVD